MAETEKSLTPESFLKRSPLYLALRDRGARFTEIDNAAVADGFGDDDEGENHAVHEMAICDLSPLPRLGFKGKGALEWLRQQGVIVGEDDNQATTQSDGSLAARLAPTEALILGGLSWENALLARLEDNWSIDTAVGCYAVPRSAANFWFLITGRHASDMFAKLCGVDLRSHKFPVNMIAQTSVARISGIIIRTNVGTVPGFHLLGDAASALYMLNCVEDAMGEFDGKPIGISAVRRALAE
jgi:sarcosine oxidase, subunit gamma